MECDPRGIRTSYTDTDTLTDPSADSQIPISFTFEIISVDDKYYFISLIPDVIMTQTQ